MEQNRIDDLTFRNEASVIGAILLDQDSFGRVEKIIDESMFYYEAYSKIFAAARKLVEDCKPVVPIMIANITGFPMDALMQCMDYAVTSANDETYAHLVKEAAINRKLVQIAERIQGNSQNEGTGLDELIQELENLREGKVQSKLVDSTEMLDEFYNMRAKVDSGESQTVPTGFPVLDEILGGGLVKGGLIVLGAYSGTGKTSIAINIAEHVSGPVLFVSCEMTPLQIMIRRIACKTGIQTKRLSKKELGEDDYSKIADATQFFTGSEFIVSRDPAVRVGEIAAMAASVQGLQMVVIDYLGLVQADDPRGSRYEDVSQISRALKMMALKLDVPVLCLSQFSRDCVKKSNGEQQIRRPTTADLRDSGQIEADADAVLLLYPTGKPQNEWSATPVNMVIAKNRHGEAGKEIEFEAFLQNCRFVEGRLKNG